MLLQLLNKLLNDEEGISEDAYNALMDWLLCERPTQYETELLEQIAKKIKAINGRRYITENLEITQ